MSKVLMNLSCLLSHFPQSGFFKRKLKTIDDDTYSQVTNLTTNVLYSSQSESAFVRGGSRRRTVPVGYSNPLYAAGEEVVGEEELLSDGEMYMRPRTNALTSEMAIRRANSRMADYSRDITTGAILKSHSGVSSSTQDGKDVKHGECLWDAVQDNSADEDHSDCSFGVSDTQLYCGDLQRNKPQAFGEDETLETNSSSGFSEYVSDNLSTVFEKDQSIASPERIGGSRRRRSSAFGSSITTGSACEGLSSQNDVEDPEEGSD